MYRDKFWLGLLTLSVVSFFVALVAHGYIGFFTRYFADDYCKASLLLCQGCYS